MEYSSADLKTAKKKITKIFFGGSPDSDIPFLWKLKDEIETAVDLILALQQYTKLENSFLNRANPRFSRIAYVMASEENCVLSGILEHIENETHCKPICLIYDGAIVENISGDSAEKIE